MLEIAEHRAERAEFEGLMASRTPLCPPPSQFSHFMYASDILKASLTR